MSTTTGKENTAAAKPSDVSDRPGRTHAMVVTFIVIVCGLCLAGVLALIAALVAALLHADAIDIFTISGGTFGACLTLELGLAGVYTAVRHRST